MATIPLYQRQVQPTGATAGVEAQAVLGSPRAAGQVWDAIGDFAGQVGKSSEQAASFFQQVHERKETELARAQMYEYQQELNLREERLLEELKKMDDPKEMDSFFVQWRKTDEQFLNDFGLHKKNQAMGTAIWNARSDRIASRVLGLGGVVNYAEENQAALPYFKQKINAEKGIGVIDPETGEEIMTPEEAFEDSIEHLIALGPRFMDPIKAEQERGQYKSVRLYYKYSQRMQRIDLLVSEGQILAPEYIEMIEQVQKNFDDEKTPMFDTHSEPIQTTINAKRIRAANMAARAFQDEQKELVKQFTRMEDQVEKGSFTFDHLKRIEMTHGLDMARALRGKLAVMLTKESTTDDNAQKLTDILGEFSQTGDFSAAIRAMDKVDDPLTAVALVVLGDLASSRLDENQPLEIKGRWRDGLRRLAGRPRIPTEITASNFSEAFVAQVIEYTGRMPEGERAPFAEKALRAFLKFRADTPNPTEENVTEFVSEQLNPVAARLIQESYRQGLSSKVPTESLGELPRVSTEADWERLPSGAQYIDPNGVTRRKQ